VRRSASSISFRSGWPPTAYIAGLPHAFGEHQVVFLQLGQHVFGCDEIRTIVLDILHPGDVTDRADFYATDLAR
jgi:hypothetical protein